MSPQKQKSSASTSSRMKTTNKLYDVLEKEVQSLVMMMALLSAVLILSTVMLVIAVIIIVSFRIEHFRLFSILNFGELSKIHLLSK